jgi:hypothetical protein
VTARASRTRKPEPTTEQLCVAVLRRAKAVLRHGEAIRAAQSARLAALDADLAFARSGMEALTVVLGLLRAVKAGAA